MSANIDRSNLSTAWLAGIEYLLGQGGRAANMVTTIRRPVDEDKGIRRTLDEFIAERQRAGVALASVSRVADLIFPDDLYLPHLGTRARAHLYEMEELAFRKMRHQRLTRTGTYFHRMVDWATPSGSINQLEQAISRLNRQLQQSNPKSSMYEFAIYRPDIDRSIMGFPCLSYVSLTLLDQRVHMTALYRNQHFLRKTYGNYVGLARLLQFICQETNCEVGELVCIATHADAEVGLTGVGKRRLTTFLDTCRKSAISRDLIQLRAV